MSLIGSAFDFNSKIWLTWFEASQCVGEGLKVAIYYEPYSN